MGNSTVLEEGTKSEIFKFIQRICYGGKETESLTELRVILYKNMKTKFSQNMPAAKYSVWTKMVDEELSETYVTPLWYKSKSFHRSPCIRLVRT